jgi:hypothetical protein
MADYQLTATDVVLRTIDGAFIPNDPANRDRAEYEAWLVGGGIPDPYIAPPPPPLVPATTTVMYNHENRLRSLEGQPAISLGDFITTNGL